MSDMDGLPEFFHGLDDSGRWVLRVRGADGTERGPTPAEQDERDRRFAESVASMSNEARNVLTAMQTESFRPPLSSRYLEFTAWAEGRNPGYAPSMADLVMLAAERQRGVYGAIGTGAEAPAAFPTDSPDGGQGGAGAGDKPTRRKRTPVHRRLRKSPRVANVDMIAVHKAKQGGLSFRAIARDRKKNGLKGTSPTTLKVWYDIAEATLNPNSRSKGVRQTLPQDQRGQTDVSRDRRLD